MLRFFQTSEKIQIFITVLENDLSLTNSLSEYLQNPKLIYSRANSLCEATIKTLTEAKKISEFNAAWKETNSLALKVNIPDPCTQTVPQKRRKVASKCLRIL